MKNLTAKFWNVIEDNIVICTLCPHNCRITPGNRGICRVRENQDGRLVAINYGIVSSLALDPIEKKPLDFFYPGSQILSIGGFGCNFHCPFCQNSNISLEYEEFEENDFFQAANLNLWPKGCSNGEILTPDDILRFALQTVLQGNNVKDKSFQNLDLNTVQERYTGVIGVAYTYNEPLIGYEFVYDCARLIHEAGLKNVLVTNGFINEEALLELLPFIDAMNIDLKAFTPEFYQKIGGDLAAVKKTIAHAHEKCHVEVTTLVIPNENEEDIIEIAKWLAELNPAIPYHLTRFYPRYKYETKSPTNTITITRLAEEASKYLHNVLI